MTIQNPFQAVPEEGSAFQEDDFKAPDHDQRQPNVHKIERGISGIAGGALTAYGLLRRDWWSVPLGLVGGLLAYRAISGQSYLYRALGVDTSRTDLPPMTSVPHRKGIRIERVVTIERTPEELFQYWRSFENLPRILSHLKEVHVTDVTHSHWVANAPLGQEVEWDAVIINEQPNELIAWQSLEGSQIGNAGSVHFTPAPGGRGTEVRVELAYVPPVGKVGALLAKLLGEEPELQVREDLRHFKEVMEATEVPTTEGQSSGR